jgi:hypothetical protein
LVALVHPKALAPSLTLLCWEDLDGGLVAMRYGRGSCLHLSWCRRSPRPPDLVGWHDGATLHMSMSMVKLRSLATDSLHQRIRNLQANSDGGEAGEVVARCFWCLCFGSWSGGGGSLSLHPTFLKNRYDLDGGCHMLLYMYSNHSTTEEPDPSTGLEKLRSL